MFPASCILLCLAVEATHQYVFTYLKPWDPFRRSSKECEMCYNGDCVIADGSRCEYYAEASTLISTDKDDDTVEIHRDNVKMDTMLFEFVELASSTPQSQDCIPLVSQSMDCTEENICTGCKFCNCNEEGRWICSEKQRCRPEPKLAIDHRVIGVVIENLKRKERPQQRVKRSADAAPDNKISYTDISKWMYGVEPFNYEHTDINIGQILEYLKDNKTILDRDIDAVPFSSALASTSEPLSATEIFLNKTDNYADLLEFNDILQSLTIDELNTKKPFGTSHTFVKHRSEEVHTNDIYFTEFDPIRLVKRDISNLKKNENPAILAINATTNNVTYSHALVLIDALQGLNKIINEKQMELNELLNIQNNLLNIAKEHNIAVNVNSTLARNNYNKHHIAIYKLDRFEECIAQVKQDICGAIKDVITTNTVSKSSDLQRDLNVIFSAIRNLIFHKNNSKLDPNIISSQERDQNSRRHIEPENRYQHFNPTLHLVNILVEINKSPTNPLSTLSQHTRKILKRVIKQLYLDDFAIIDSIIHETYYDFDSYLGNIGTKWNKMMQDVVDSQVFDLLHRIKLLHITLKADISKMDDMITLLDFARNRRMTVANGVTIDTSILRIQNNLRLIDDNIQKITKLKKNKRTKQAPGLDNKVPKKKSIIQKLKTMFQNSKNDIKEMLRKRFPKSEIMKQIAKKKIDELEKQRMLEYQETMKQWQETLNVVPGREKRSAWKLFQGVADRIKNIIPKYLRRKVKPAMQKKKSNNKTQIRRTSGRKKKRHPKPTTVTIPTISRRSTVT